MASNGQRTQRFENEELQFERALLLFENQNYTNAQHEFESILKSKSFSEHQQIDALYYSSISALYLDQPTDYSVKRLVDFSVQNPNHPKAKLALYHIASYYFQNKKFAEATQYYNQISLADFDDERKNKGRFELAYAYFELKEYDLAENNFDRMKNQSSKYGYAANYYSGYIKLKKQKYDQALLDFKTAEQNETYASAVPVMITNIYYKQGETQKLIDYAGPIAESKKGVTNKNEIIGLLAESYYSQQKYTEAQKWYQTFTSGQKTKDQSVHYKYGYSAYQLKDYQTAASQFKMIAGTTDSIAQGASYLLGNSYLKLGQQDYALNAFKEASEVSFDGEIQEIALYNAGKILYAKGNFSQALSTFATLKSKYPNFKESREVDQLVTESYLNSNNYQAALDYIQKLPKPRTDRINKVYQKVAHDQALKQFNSQNFNSALTYFDQALENPFDKTTEIESQYWKSEVLSKQGNWNLAINSYARIFQLDAAKTTPYYYLSFYGIGYAYFNTQQYDKAQSKFEGFINSRIVNSSSDAYSSALVRIGDCELVKKNFTKARLKYQAAIDLKSPQSGYAHYASGLSHYHQNNDVEALKEFNAVIAQHQDNIYYEKALFQKSYVLLTMNNSNQAMESFTQLIKQKPQSKSLPAAYYYRAKSYQNMKLYSNAISDYDFIIKNYCRASLNGSTPLAAEVLAELEAIAGKDALSSDEYLQRLNRVSGCVPGINIELKKYELARSQFFEGNFETAITSLESFKAQYPASTYLSDVNFHLAESYYYTQNIPKSKAIFQSIYENSPDNHYLESVYYLGEIANLENDYPAVKQFNSILLQYADQQSQRLEAHLNLMKSCFELGLYPEAIQHANTILASELTLPYAASQANVFKGKSYYLSGDTTAAQTIFKKEITQSKDQFGAESLYYLAKIKQDQGQYKNSNQLLIKLNADYKAEKLWVSKSYLLIGDNYVLMNEELQAKATYKSIIEYSGFEEIKQQAQAKLNHLLNQQQILNDLQGTIQDTLTIPNPSE